MNTLLPYRDFVISARLLDVKRLGQQRMDCKTILAALTVGEYKCLACHTHYKIREKPQCMCGGKLVKVPLYSHPAVEMWKGYEDSLKCYSSVICHEWIDRGYKDNLLQRFKYKGEPTPPPWLGYEPFHLSHRSNLVRKNSRYYRVIFGFDTPDHLPFHWPTREKHD